MRARMRKKKDRFDVFHASTFKCQDAKETRRGAITHLGGSDVKNRARIAAWRRRGDAPERPPVTGRRRRRSLCLLQQNRAAVREHRGPAKRGSHSLDTRYITTCETWRPPVCHKVPRNDLFLLLFHLIHFWNKTLVKKH